MNKKKALVLFPLLLLIISSNFLIRFSKISYNTLLKPSFAPPMIVFILAWSIIYIILYITTYNTIKKTENYKYLIIKFYILLLFHFFWILFFFTLNFQLLSIIMLITIYIISISYILSLYSKNKKALSANLFYLLWLLYALILNLSIYYIN